MNRPSANRDAVVLRVRDLTVGFADKGAELLAVDRLSMELRRGRSVALVGESGCGKSTAALALASLIAPPGRIVSGSVQYRGQELLGAAPQVLRRIRGQHLALTFQEPGSALNPLWRIGPQVAEPYRLHTRSSKSEARHRVLEVMAEVGIPEPEKRWGAYPHELSGGLQQRVMLAMALVTAPEVLICDEPTTALDVTIQAQILALLRRLQRERQMALLFVTHDLALVEAIADEIAVMYAGRLVEQGPTAQLLTAPRHPYTRALWQSNPAAIDHGPPFPVIEGTVPPIGQRPSGCVFHDRCPRPVAQCRVERPPFDGTVACFRPHGGEGRE